MLQSKLITYTAPDLTATVTVARASVLTGLHRNRLIKAGLKYETDDPDLLSLCCHHWPVVRAGTTEGTITVIYLPEDRDGDDDVLPLFISISELTFEQFTELPEDLIAQWYSAVLDLNPHWSARGPEPEPGSAEGNASSADAESNS